MYIPGLGLDLLFCLLVVLRRINLKMRVCLPRASCFVLGGVLASLGFRMVSRRVSMSAEQEQEQLSGGSKSRALALALSPPLLCGCCSCFAYFSILFFRH